MPIFSCSALLGGSEPPLPRRKGADSRRDKRQLQTASCRCLAQNWEPSLLHAVLFSNSSETGVLEGDRAGGFAELEKAGEAGLVWLLLVARTLPPCSSQKGQG